MRILRITTVIACTALAAASATAVQQAKKTAAKPAINEKAMTDMMQTLATPGDGHKKLDVLVGSWDAKVSMWMDPAAAPMVSQGTSQHKWILGGRHLEQRFEGTFMNMPFSGLGYTGYDNYRKQYISSWMDTASTSVMNLSGTFDAAGKVMTMTGKMDDPAAGKTVTVREKMTVVSRDEVLFEMFGPGPDGKDYRMMEIRYTRKK